jgi:hypothetical protein
MIGRATKRQAKALTYKKIFHLKSGQSICDDAL